jgi:hypothetical protein
VPLALAAVLLPVVVYCSVRSLAPRLGGASTEHRRDIDVWHMLMGTAMTAMLFGLPPVGPRVNSVVVISTT